MNVLSLFDGISCGRVALERAGIKVDKYYASEVDKGAMLVTKTNYPDTIFIGDVREVKASELPEIDLFIGGSPCTNLSTAGKKNGMITKDKKLVKSLDMYISYKEKGYEFDGYSYLFWEYVRLLKEVKPKYFLLENVHMKKEWEELITKELGVEPIVINSSLVSAQNRVRYYWTNIPVKGQPEDKGIKLSDILEDFTYTNKGTIIGRRLNKDGHREDYNKEIPIVQCLEVRASNTDKSNCLTRVEKDNVLTSLPIGRHKDAYGMISGKRLPFRHYTRLEYERLQTLSDGYTNVLSESSAKKAIGNAWTVDVISFIFSFIKE